MGTPTTVTHLFVTIAFCGWLCGCSAAQPQSMGGPPAREMPVRVQPVGQRTVDDTSTYVATIKSRKSVNLKPLVASRILQLCVKSGDYVKEGQAVAVLDESKQKALVASADAGIESTQADRNNAEAMLKSLQASKVSKLANVDFEHTQLERYKKLMSQGAVSTEMVDQHRNQTSVAEAELEAINAQIKAQEASIARNEKQIVVAQSNKREQQEQLKYFTVRAPFSGVIGDVPCRIGDYVDTNTTLTTVDQSHPMELYINVPTAQSGHLSKGLQTQVLDSKGIIQEVGRIFFISPEVDNSDQSVLVKAELANRKDVFRSGQIVNARVVWEQVATLTVPTAAVTRFSGQDFVFVAVPDNSGKIHARQQAVRLGEIDGNEYRVLAGIKAGERIVCSGAQNLADGLPIKPQM